MNRNREAAARRAQLRKILSTKTQADVATAQRELLEQLGSSVSLRTLKRDLQILRKSVTKGTHAKGARGVNRSKAGSNTSMTKKIEQMEKCLDGIDQTLRALTDVLSRIVPDLYERDRKLREALLHNEYRHVADRKEMLAQRDEFERMRDAIAAAGAYDGEHTHH